jgi:hypothetical protein
MASIPEYVETCVKRLSTAAAKDRAAISESRSGSKTAGAVSLDYLEEELRRIGKQVEGSTLTEEQKKDVAERIAEGLGSDEPTTLRGLIKKGSVDAMLAMSQDTARFLQSIPSTGGPKK